MRAKQLEILIRNLYYILINFFECLSAACGRSRRESAPPTMDRWGAACFTLYSIVTCTALDALLPLASRAVAVNVCSPRVYFFVFH